MPKYKYSGAGKTFPTLGITVKDGDTFEGPVGLRGQGISLVTSEPSAPAETPKKKESVKFNPKAIDGDGDGFVQDGTEFERPVEQVEINPSDSDISAGA